MKQTSNELWPATSFGMMIANILSWEAVAQVSESDWFAASAWGPVIFPITLLDSAF
jgi:hypothetical protein